MVFKLCENAELSWNRISGFDRLAEVISGIEFPVIVLKWSFRVVKIRIRCKKNISVLLLKLLDPRFRFHTFADLLLVLSLASEPAR